jgi:hypothetical protein
LVVPMKAGGRKGGHDVRAWGQFTETVEWKLGSGVGWAKSPA